MTKRIKNTLYGNHFNSKHWQNYKLNLPKLPENCFNVAVGMILGDATMYHVSREAYIKFEQGWKQQEFLYNLFDVFSNYCFMQQPSIRLDNNQKLKSYWFKTFSFPDFTFLYHLFYENKKKIVRVGLIKDYLTPIGLAYWIMCDGSLQKDGRTLIIHTQGFTLEENTFLSNELNEKFNLHTQVSLHKTQYYVIKIPSKDAQLIYNLVNSWTIPSMLYKLPRLNQS